MVERRIPYYALVAFGRWEAILAEEPPPEDLLYPTTIWRYARGMAHAAQGETKEAERMLAAIERAADDERLEEITIWDINETGDLVEIAAQLLRAEIAGARGETEAQIAALRRAVELEDALNYDEPPPWGPATRRYLGAALLRAGRPEAAEQAYREDLENFPENGWALFGLLESLRAQGRSADAKEVEDRFQEAWKHAGVTLTASRL